MSFTLVSSQLYNPSLLVVIRKLIRCQIFHQIMCSKGLRTSRSFPRWSKANWNGPSPGRFLVIALSTTRDRCRSVQANQSSVILVRLELVPKSTEATLCLEFIAPRRLFWEWIGILKWISGRLVLWWVQINDERVDATGTLLLDLSWRECLEYPTIVSSRYLAKATKTFRGQKSDTLHN